MMSDARAELSPRERTNFLGADEVERKIVQAIDAGAMAGGWLITGGEGVGKATFAFRVARALLDKERRAGAALEESQAVRSSALIASGGHPDLFVAEPAYDEKKERYASDISVETIRRLTDFLHHTSSFGGWRVAIVDTADHLNRNAANALLKILEEPPANAALLLLSAAPGRLIATIRSRCRRLELRPLGDEAVAGFLADEGYDLGVDDPAVRAAAGRPGFALSLAAGPGRDATALLEAYLKSIKTGRDISAVAAKLGGKGGDAVWPVFKTQLLATLKRETRLAAQGESGFFSASPHKAVDVHDDVAALLLRGDAVNVDRLQLAHGAARMIAPLVGR